MRIVEDDLTDPAVADLLRLHLAGMQENSPPDSVYALDLSGLQTPKVTVWTAWAADALMGIGALNELAPSHGEIKSMRTHPDHTRKGVGRRLLEHIIEVARCRGYERLSLETGSGPAFEAAIGLYRRYGFENGAAFSDYESTEFNQFMHLRL